MGDIVTTKSDVYSFAMILWELLTSSIPFKEFLYGPGASGILRQWIWLSIGATCATCVCQNTARHSFTSHLKYRPVFTGITPGLARLRCIEIFTNDLRPEMPGFMSVQKFFGELAIACQQHIVIPTQCITTTCEDLDATANHAFWCECRDQRSNLRRAARPHPSVLAKVGG